MTDALLLSNPGQTSGIYVRFGELQRRLANLEASRGYLNGINGAAIAPGTINGSSIVAASITTGALAAGVITADLIAAGAIVAGHISAGAISTVHLAALAITAETIASDAIIARHITAGTVTATHIAAGTITAQHIASATITAGQIAAGTITASQIATDTITAGQIAAGTITANEMAANSIATTHLQAGAVTANSISANSIYTAALQAGAVTADKVTVSSLSALTTNMGSITAGTITGGTLQTAATGSRVVMDSLGLRGYALDGVTKVFEINAGSGVASFTGIANIDPLSVIPGGTVTAGTLPGDRIVAGSVATAQLAAGSVVANTIAAGAVTASKITVEFGGNNLLYNSSFEDAAAFLNVTWGVYEGFPATPTVVALSDVVSGVVARDGSRVCSIERLGSGTGATYAAGTYGSGTYAGPAGTAAHAGIYQTQKAVPGQTYTVSVYAMIPATRSSQSLRIRVDDPLAVGGYWGGPSELVTVPNDGVWRRYTNTFVYAPNGSAANATTNVQVFFWMESAPNNALIYLDAAQMEPGEYALGYSRRPGEVLTGEIGPTQITPNSITTNQIMAGTIQGGDIAGTTITGENILGSTITADKLLVTSLSAITADMGAMTAGTITGAVIRTAASGTRISLDSTGFKQFLGSSGVPAIHFKTDGTDDNVFTGKITARSLDFVSTNAGAVAGNSVMWLAAGTLVEIGRMSQYEIGGGQQQDIWSGSSAGSNYTLIRSYAHASASAITIAANSSGTIATRGLLTYDGKSDYLQLTPGTPRKSGVGTALVTWDGTTSYSSYAAASPLGVPVTGIIGSSEISSTNIPIIVRGSPSNNLVIGYTANGSIPPAGTTALLQYMWWL